MQKVKKLFVAGTFDTFHMGHQFFLWSAYAMCEELVVIIARDTTVRKIKGNYSFHTELERLQRIQDEALPHTTVRLGREDGDFFETLREEAPEVIFLGYDQKFDENKCREIFPQIDILRCTAYNPELFKSSKFR